MRFSLNLHSATLWQIEMYRKVKMFLEKIHEHSLNAIYNRCGWGSVWLRDSTSIYSHKRHILSYPPQHTLSTYVCIWRTVIPDPIIPARSTWCWIGWVGGNEKVEQGNCTALSGKQGPCALVWDTRHGTATPIHTRGGLEMGNQPSNKYISQEKPPGAYYSVQ